MPSGMPLAFPYAFMRQHPLATSSGTATVAAQTWVGSLASPSPSMEQYKDDEDGHDALPANERTSLL
ncbi:hypothetical protein ACA910_020568 [Epithemia clementina (nom. ined.)]